MSPVERAKVRELLTRLTTSEGRGQFLADPPAALRAHGIDPPADLPLPQKESDMPSVERYKRALDALDADRFGQDYTHLNSPELGAFIIWLRATPPDHLR
jgi:hypothetical protein